MKFWEVVGTATKKKIGLDFECGLYSDPDAVQTWSRECFWDA